MRISPRFLAAVLWLSGCSAHPPQNADHQSESAINAAENAGNLTIAPQPAPEF